MTFEAVFRLLYQTGPVALLVGAAATAAAGLLYAVLAGPERRSLWRFLGASLAAGAAGYGIGAVAGIAIACSTPRGGSLCGLMGLFGLGPLLAGVAMFGYACYRALSDIRR